MSKRVNNKKGNHAKRKKRYGHPTAVRGAPFDLGRYVLPREKREREAALEFSRLREQT